MVYPTVRRDIYESSPHKVTHGRNGNADMEDERNTSTVGYTTTEEVDMNVFFLDHQGHNDPLEVECLRLGYYFKGEQLEYLCEDIEDVLTDEVSPDSLFGVKDLTVTIVRGVTVTVDFLPKDKPGWNQMKVEMDDAALLWFISRCVRNFSE